jgi:hypothetical protein
MPVRGIKQVRKNVTDIIGEIGGSMSEKAVYESLIIIDGNAALLTPVDTSNLINSRFIEVKKLPTGVQGRMGYTAEYAAAVHNSPGTYVGANEPRASNDPSRGNMWDPNAEPEFLTKGAENAKADIDRVIKKRMRL